MAARQELTRERWNRILTDFECYVSILVVQEAEGGDADAACARLKTIAGMASAAD